MKKIVLSLALVAMMSVSFVSCKDAAATDAVTEEAAPVMEEAVEAAAATTDTAAAVATEAVEGAAAATTDAAATAVEATADAAKAAVKK